MAKAVAKKDAGTAVQEEMPDFMKSDVGKGMENLDSSDIAIPRLALLQAVSNELTDYEGLQPGQFFHKSVEQQLGNSLKIVPVFIDKRYILWRPRVDGGGILARADDAIHWMPADEEFEVKIEGGQKVKWKTAKTVAQSGLAEWGTYNPNDKNSPPAASLMYSIVCVLPDHMELGLCIVGLQRSSIGVGKQLFAKMGARDGAPVYSTVYTMESAQAQGPSGPFFTYKFTSTGFVKNKAFYEKLRDTNEAMSKRGITDRDLETTGDESGANARPAADTKKRKF